MLASTTLAFLLSVSSVFALSVVDHHGARPAAHNHRRSPAHPLPVRDQSLAKRFDGARWTYYATGLGACGGYNKDSDFIVALNIEQWDGGSHCNDMITMSYGGKTTQAQIVDQCPGCPFGGLDLSPGLFDFFASEDLGVITGQWSFGSGGGNSGSDPTSYQAPKPTTSKKPKTTSTPEPTPTPTPTSTTHKKTSTTSSSSSVPPTTTSTTPTSTSVSSSTASSSTTPSSAALPTITDSSVIVTTVNSVGNLGNSNNFVAQMGLLVKAAAAA